MAWKKKLLALMVACFAILGVACDDAEDNGDTGNGGLDNGTETDDGLGDDLGDVGDELGDAADETGDAAGEAADETGDAADDVTDDGTP